MQKPIPGLTEEEALEDIKKGIDYLHETSKKYNIIKHLGHPMKLGNVVSVATILRKNLF